MLAGVHTGRGMFPNADLVPGLTLVSISAREFDT